MKLIEFSRYLARLKRLKRTGWLREGVKDSESVADHSFGIALLAMVLAKEYGLNQSKAIKMALVHDMGEALIGDIVTERGTKIDTDMVHKKIPRQRAATKRIFSLMNDKEALALYDEFQENKTREAKLIKQLDKLEMVMQAYDYENTYGVDLGEFYQNASMAIKDRRIRRELEKLSYARLKKGRRAGR